VILSPSTRSPAASKTRMEPSAVSTGSSKRSSTRLGDSCTTASFFGSVAMSTE
jgi:hypothetical protein